MLMILYWYMKIRYICNQLSQHFQIFYFQRYIWVYTLIKYVYSVTLHRGKNFLKNQSMKQYDKNIKDALLSKMERIDKPDFTENRLNQILGNAARPYIFYREPKYC